MTVRRVLAPACLVPFVACGGSSATHASDAGDAAPLSLDAASTDAAFMNDGGVLSDSAVADADGGAVGCSDAGALSGSAYFVAPKGDDSNAGSIDAPFATIQHCASVATAGTTCYLRAGTYRETVTPKGGGGPGAPVTFTSYPCERAIVSGADLITAWTQSHGSIYVAPLTTLLTETGTTTPRTQLFIDGKPGTLARWPNVKTTAFLDPDDDATAATGTTATSIVDPLLSSFDAGTWTGALIHVRGGYAWTSLVGSVSAATGDTLTLTIASDPNLSPKAGSRYYLANLLAALDAPGEWYASGSQLSAWMPGGDAPSKHVVEAKQRDLAFNLSGLSNVVIRDLELFAATIMTDAKTSAITIDSIVAAYPSYFTEEDGNYYTAHNADTGIQLNGTGNTLENSEIFGSTNNGVVVSGTGMTVTNCLIHDIDSMAVYSDPIFLKGGSGHQITHNTIFQTGRDGIYAGGSPTENDVIAYNDIHDYGVLNQDLGGLYGFGIDWTGTVVHHNWVHDIVPSTDRGFTGAAVGSGLYFDNGSVNFTAHHNVTWQTNNGIQLNGSEPKDGGASTEPSAYVYNNTVGPNTEATAKSVACYPSPIDATGSRLINNIFAGGELCASANFSGVTMANNVLPGVDAGFVDASGFDFELAVGSPAKGGGEVISGVTTTIPPDIGAYEGGDFTPGCSLAGCR